MSPLHTAVPLIEVHIVAMLVTKHLNLMCFFLSTFFGQDTYLNFHMPWVNHKLLEQHDLVAKALHGLPLGAVQLRVEVLGSQADPHSFPASSSHRLDHHWVADLFSLRAEVLDLTTTFDC